jgi:hypothetical protein
MPSSVLGRRGEPARPRVVQSMKMIQIRNVPEELHRSLKERAAREGTTQSDLILSDLPDSRVGRLPTSSSSASGIALRSAGRRPPS